MKIFFTASSHGQEKYQKYYTLVLKEIEKLNVEIISPELGNYKNLIPKERQEILKDEKLIHYEAIKVGIQWADVIIIEISHEDFQLGHEATLAIQNKKPVLCLSIHEDFSRKINNKYFFGAKYDTFTIELIVKNFIMSHKKELLKQRFNLFLSQSQVNILEEESGKLDMSKSEFIRKLIKDNREKKSKT